MNHREKWPLDPLSSPSPPLHPPAPSSNKLSKEVLLKIKRQVVSKGTAEIQSQAKVLLCISLGKGSGSTVFSLQGERRCTKKSYKGPKNKSRLLQLPYKECQKGNRGKRCTNPRYFSLKNS